MPGEMKRNERREELEMLDANGGGGFDSEWERGENFEHFADDEDEYAGSGAKKAGIGLVVVVILLFLMIIISTELIAARFGSMVSNIVLAAFTGILFLIFYRREIKAFVDERFGEGAKDDKPMENYGNTKEYYEKYYKEYHDSDE